MVVINDPVLFRSRGQRKSSNCCQLSALCHTSHFCLFGVYLISHVVHWGSSWRISLPLWMFLFCLLEVIEVLTFLCTNNICLFRIEKNTICLELISISGMAAPLVLLKFNLIFEIFGMNLRDIYEIHACCASLKTSVAFAYLWKYGNTKVHSSHV